MKSNLYYSYTFKNKKENHCFFDNLKIMFESAIEEWTEMEDLLKSEYSSEKQKENYRKISNSRKKLKNLLLEYKIIEKENNIITEFNLNKILNSEDFIAKTFMQDKLLGEFTTEERKFYDFIDGFFESFMPILMSNYFEKNIEEKRNDRFPEVEHSLYNNWSY